MDKKVVFIDIDGTLSNNDGSIPKSAEEACREAIRNGHSLYVCTGRSKPEIFDNILDIGFHGVIGAGGGYVEVEGKKILHELVAIETLDKTIAYFEKHNIAYYLESEGGLYASPTCKKVLMNLIVKEGMEDPSEHPFIKVLKDGEDMHRHDVSKICFLDEGGNINFDDIEDKFNDLYEVHHCTVPIFGENSGELAVKGVNKGKAINYLLNYTQEDNLERYAIGDGLNDIDMFDVCSVCVAMPHAKQALKDKADFITTPIEEDGIKNAFIKLRIIV